MPEVELHCIERQGQMLWRVTAGKRVLTFHEELAARAFAAQLHLRMPFALKASWLKPLLQR